MARRDLTGAVDFAYLEAYAGGDQQVVDEVLALFREQAALWVRLLDPSSGDGGWRDAVHTLKGSARVVLSPVSGSARTVQPASIETKSRACTLPAWPGSCGSETLTPCPSLFAVA